MTEPKTTIPPTQATVGDHVDLSGLGIWRVVATTHARTILYLAPTWIIRPKPNDHISIDTRTNTITTQAGKGPLTP